MKSFISIIVICALLIFAPVVSAAESGPATGTVAETMDSGGYVYIRLEDGVWIAANTFTVSKGDEIQYSGAMEMNDFHSKTLDKSFESILFVSEASLVGSDDAVKAPVSLPGTESIRAQSKNNVVQSPEAGEIKTLADGKTIADIFIESDQLKDQVVSLNAKVVKINKAIMGKNWITLQDGTGTKPENKLVATSGAIVTPGDIVIVKGTVKTDVDLGHGYFYKVLLEDATFSPGLE